MPPLPAGRSPSQGHFDDHVPRTYTYNHKRPDSQRAGAQAAGISTWQPLLPTSPRSQDRLLHEPPSSALDTGTVGRAKED